MKEVVIVAYGRSPIGKQGKGGFKDTRPDEIAAQVVKGVLKQIPQLILEEIDDVIVGCAFPEAEQGMNMAKTIAFRAGLPDCVAAQTVNRFCSSGLQSIAIGANSIKVGEADIILAAGVESMSMVPMEGNIPAPNPWLMENYPAAHLSMGITAENVAEKYNISRVEQDEFALQSHLKAAQAQQQGRFEHQIIPIEAVSSVVDDKGYACTQVSHIDQDEGIRHNITLENLSKLRPVFKTNGTVTAGNASQMSDGAAAVLLMSADKARELGVKPIAKFVSFGVSGVDPALMGLGPIYAIPKALKVAGVSLSEVDLFELNEAFASQAIACIRELSLDMDKVNVNGGAIALGHPLGCTGSFLTAKLLSELALRQGRYGIVSMCIGGGMGAAALFEMCN